MTDCRPAANPLWRAYEVLVMVFGLGLMAFLCVVWLPCALILKPLLPAATGVRWGRRAIMGGARGYLRVLELACAFRFDLDELDCLRDEPPLIIVANHPSRLDAVLILSRLPNAVCVMKATLMDNILFGAAVRLARYISNHPPLAMILEARDELHAGGHLLIFPEGTRTVNFPVDRCTASTGLIASRSGVPVQTLLVEMSTPYLGKAWPLLRPPQLPLHCRVRVGRRFPPPTDVAAFTGELDAYFLAQLAPTATA
ncbi:MAG: 1-acyl-sn-glycerol-3-phosphate acyltransferase [Betaproteobacteria bacterium HGW-Betaproteobacteria-7]|jgi:1-acyl-sn-glycerol-3-phosphate acyltransferase|nr:MAG: 1-acyl-sn-glycerol-3-phosphate acyltransferase [Betaproteobacteria bacterium HGW-Betaproteobacteria-7]